MCEKSVFNTQVANECNNMVERPDLTYEVFVTLAQQQGLEVDSAHLGELFPEVQAMFQRMKLLDQLHISRLQERSIDVLEDQVTQE